MITMEWVYSDVLPAMCAVIVKKDGIEVRRVNITAVIAGDVLAIDVKDAASMLVFLDPSAKQRA